MESISGSYCISASPVVELHLRCLPLLEATREVGRSAEDVLHIQEELLMVVKRKKEVRAADQNQLRRLQLLSLTFMNFSYWMADSIVLEE